MVFDNGVLDQCNPRFILQPEEELQFAKYFMDHVADAVFWVEPDARFLYVNDAACCLAGYSREELLSMTMHDFDPGFSAEVWSEYWRTIKQQRFLTFESLHQTKEGWSNPLEIPSPIWNTTAGSMAVSWFAISAWLSNAGMQK